MVHRKTRSQSSGPQCSQMWGQQVSPRDCHLLRHDLADAILLEQQRASGGGSGQAGKREVGSDEAGATGTERLPSSRHRVKQTVLPSSLRASLWPVEAFGGSGTAAARGRGGACPSSRRFSRGTQSRLRLPRYICRGRLIRGAVSACIISRHCDTQPVARPTAKITVNMDVGIPSARKQMPE